MATVRNASTVTQTIPSLGVVVAPGETFEAPDDVAAELVERPDFDTPSRGAGRPTIDEVLAAVGDDPEAAAAAIADEGENPRTTLVAKLEAIIAAQTKES